MQIRDLGEEAIDEILAEAVDGMGRRTGKAWRLSIENEHGDLAISCEGKLVTVANVQPYVEKPTSDGPAAPYAIRYRSALRRLVLDATQAVSPVPGAANIPAALGMAFSAIQALDAAEKRQEREILPVVRHDLYRILDHLTGCDHSGCSGNPSVADYGRVGDVTGRIVFDPMGDPTPPKGILIREVTTHADGTTRVRTGRA